MDQLISKLTEIMNGFFSPVFTVLENALRETIRFIYPAMADHVDYHSLTPAFCALLVLAVFLILLRILSALFRRKSRRSLYFFGCLLALFVFLPGSINNARTLWHDESAYQQAHQYMSEGQYAEALEQFSEAGKYRGALDKAAALRDTVYRLGIEQQENGTLGQARRHFLCLNGYLGSAEKAAYISAQILLENGDYLEAIQAFDSLGSYEDASLQASDIRDSVYQSAVTLQESGNLEEARDRFLSLNGYKEAAEKAAYISAEILLENGDYEGALQAFSELGSYGDSEARANSVKSDLIESWTELSEKVKHYSTQRVKAYTLYFTAAMAPSNNHTQIKDILYSMGIESCGIKFDHDYPFVDVYGIVYPEHFQICSSAEETLSFINSCADVGISDFSIYFTSDYRSFLFDDDKYELDRLLACSRLKRPSERTSSGNEAISFSNAEYYPTAAGMSGIASSLDDFQKLLAIHTNALEDEFDIMVSDELKEKLSAASLSTLNRDTLSCMLYYYGVEYYYSPLSYSKRFLTFAPRYLEGTIILYAYRNNRLDLLNKREMETLQAALAIAAQASGTDLEREKKIHDYLCSHIEYYTDENEHNEDDCAIGAILNGAANCDGYSDAFYLCGNLANLQVLQMPGKTLNDDSDAGHIWNLIKINGNWVVVDVTGDDDNKNGVIHYNYYNIGLDKASVLYVWDKVAVPVQICPDTSNALRNVELAINYVDNWDQIYSVLRNNSINRNERIEISYSSTLDLFSDRDRLGSLVYSVGVKDYLWYFRDNLAEILVQEYYDNFAICDTYDEVVQYLTLCKKRGLSEYRFYCSTEKLYRQIRGYEEKVPAFWSLIRSVGLNVSKASHSDKSRMFIGTIDIQP